MFEDLEIATANLKLRVALMEHAKVLAQCAEKFSKPEYLEEAHDIRELADRFK